MDFPCISCAEPVRPRQHAIACDICGDWQHRTCNTGITSEQYRDAVRNSSEIHFVCAPCLRRELDNDDSSDELNTSVMEQDDDLPDAETDQTDLLDASFDLEHRNLDADQPAPIQEESFDADPLSDSIVEDQPVSFTVLETGSKRGGRLLTSSDGYSYCVKNNNKSSTLWRCSVKTKKCMCHATVRQVGDVFAIGPNSHLHPADPKLPLRKEVLMKAKQVAKTNMFRPAMDIVEEVITSSVSETNSFLAPKRLPLKRIVNRYRSTTRPKAPSDLQFVMDDTFIQAAEFLVDDIHVDTQRHILFATDFQMDLLCRSKEWFIDGTFRIVPAPFHQLLSIHAFVTLDGERKQFPLLFALMSRRQKRDYVAVFASVLAKLDNPCVEQCVLDFEKAAWQAIGETMPRVTIRGCVFHWTQALWRHVQDLGLGAAYRQREGVYKYIRQLLALPFLPAAHIVEVFLELKERASSPQLQQFVTYVNSQWIESTTFPPSSWSVYNQTTRTNNDVEGWHHRLNSKASHGTLGFYRLVPLLRRESELVRISVSSGDLERDIRQSAKNTDQRLQELWTKYMAREYSTARFLRACGALYEPSVLV